MDHSELIDKFLSIRTWKGEGGRAPHKPLLLLYALGKLLTGETEFPFKELEPEVRRLLQDFGPPRRSHHPEYPFWRLQKDSIWEVAGSDAVQENQSGDVSSQMLLDAGACGQFKSDITRRLARDPQLVRKLVISLLEHNFPETIHEDILQAIGVDLADFEETKTKRSPGFREKVMQAYEYRCAICGFDVRLGHFPVGLEAAHIKWHVAGGPDAEENGLALCALHHKLFDRGAFTLSKENIVLVSDRANGTESFQQWLMKYHGKRISPPQRERYQPDLNFVSWHTREVFQGTFRE